MSVNVGGNSLESEIARSYNSFSGSDITAMIGNIKFAEIQAISYSVTREKAPLDPLIEINRNIMQGLQTS